MAVIVLSLILRASAHAAFSCHFLPSQARYVTIYVTSAFW